MRKDSISMRRILVRWFPLLMVFVFGGTAWKGVSGQQLDFRGAPATPTLSPYLQLGQVNNGPLPDYYAFVQPRQAILRQQQMQLQAIRRLEGSPRSPQEAWRSTGRGGFYMNFLHYYPTHTVVRN